MRRQLGWLANNIEVGVYNTRDAFGGKAEELELD